MKNYIKHLVECQCILKIFEKKTKPLYHKFIVFSVIDENDNILEKFVECNNCGAIHKINEINKSEIIHGKDMISGLVTKINDIRSNLNNINDLSKQISNLLDSNKITEICIWEHAEFLLENKIEGIIQLEKNEIKDSFIIKNLYIYKDTFKIKTETFQRYL